MINAQHPSDAPSIEGSGHSERTTRELLRLRAPREVDFDFVAAEAGDRRLAGAELQQHEEIRARLGNDLHTEMLFVLAHVQYPPDEARWRWKHILGHKRALKQHLGREVGIAVAALDYLTNIAEHFRQLTLIPEQKLLAVAEVATRDGMTGLYDHTSFFVSLRREVRRHERYEEPVSLIMLDVDHFKAYNDAKGHRAGDRVLAEIGRVISEQIRDVDIAARYGGEEFAVLAPSTYNPAAYMLAERLRLAIEDELATEGITASLGVSTCPDDGAGAESLIQAADRALYRAKEQGRNQTRRRIHPQAVCN